MYLSYTPAMLGWCLLKVKIPLVLPCSILSFSDTELNSVLLTDKCIWSKSDLFIFGSVVYNQANVYIYQDFLKVVVHAIITNQWSQTTCKYKFQATVIYSHPILVTAMSVWCVKRVIGKTWTGTLANSADPDQMPQNMACDQGLNCLLKLYEVKG